MTLFEELALVALVIIVCAVCLCAHYLQIVIKKLDVGEKVAAAKGGGGYARR